MLDAAAAGEDKGFIGERYDADAGLQYLNARYYDPKLAMFIQPDWFEVTEPGVGTNRFSYSGNDPVNKMDPGGNQEVEEDEYTQEQTTETRDYIGMRVLADFSKIKGADQLGITANEFIYYTEDPNIGFDAMPKGYGTPSDLATERVGFHPELLEDPMTFLDKVVLPAFNGKAVGVIDVEGLVDPTNILAGGSFSVIVTYPDSIGHGNSLGQPAKIFGDTVLGNRTVISPNPEITFATKTNVATFDFNLNPRTGSVTLTTGRPEAILAIELY